MKMKFVVIFLIVCVAMAAAAPQIIAAFPGYAAVAPYPVRTLVAGPTVINGFAGRYVYPGYVGPAIV